MRELAARCAVPDPLVADLAEHSVLRTTVARIQELLSVAQEYQGVLGRLITATRSRLKAGDRSGAHFRPEDSKRLEQRYWMNHCRKCGAKIGDRYEHKPGEAFFPTIEDEMSRLRGELLSGPHTYVEPDLAVSSWTSTWPTLVRRA
jgi:hypothetical protein